MARREDKVEHLAKVLFDHMRYVHDIHEVGWPRWASECDKADYRKLATWHLSKLQAEHARAVRIVKKKIRSLEACIASDKRDGNEAGATLHVYALSILNSTLVEMQKGRAQ